MAYGFKSPDALIALSMALARRTPARPPRPETRRLTHTNNRRDDGVGWCHEEHVATLDDSGERGVHDHGDHRARLAAHHLDRCCLGVIETSQ